MKMYLQMMKFTLFFVLESAGTLPIDGSCTILNILYDIRLGYSTDGMMGLDRNDIIQRKNTSHILSSLYWFSLACSTSFVISSLRTNTF